MHKHKAQGVQPLGLAESHLILEQSPGFPRGQNRTQKQHDPLVVERVV